MRGMKERAAFFDSSSSPKERAAFFDSSSSPKERTAFFDSCSSPEVVPERNLLVSFQLRFTMITDVTLLDFCPFSKLLLFVPPLDACSEDAE